MKCIYIGDFNASYSTENYIADGLIANGVEVIKIREQELNDFQMVINEKPDFVLFCKGRILNGTKLLELLKKNNILTVTWLFDLYWDLPKEIPTNRSVNEWVFKADMVFTSDGGHEEQWKTKGINHFVLRQGIYSKEAVIGKKQDAPPILFIGSVTYYAREKLVDYLRFFYKDKFKLIGNPQVRGLALNDLLASTKIVVGDSVPIPNYWSNRVYEITGRGGFLLHPEVEGLKEEIPDLVTFKYGNFQDLTKKIKYYLDNEDEREKIKLDCFNYTKKNLTYERRCKELLFAIQRRRNIK